MSSTVTSRDVQEIVLKLSSDKAKAREEGIRLLNTWLEGEKSILFCKYLSDKTASLKPDEIPHSETWPYMIRLLIQCVTSELLSSKRRLPKLNFAKTLRMVVQRAVDPKNSGDSLPLLPVAKLLFNHVFDVLKDVLSFQSEYAVILRHLLAVHDYRFHMRKHVYCDLVLLYIGKVQASLDIKSSGLSNPKEDVFRCVLTLHSLLESPPVHFPDDLREDIAQGFVKIFTHIRDEGKISRKLIECINTYLMKDGPNLSGLTLEIYDAMHKFVFRCWMTTHDRSLKDALILFARLKLSLTRGTDDGGPLLEQLLEVLSKELDILNNPNSALPRNDASRDDKCGILTTSQHALLELAALVFCRACTGSKASFAEKRARREHVVVQIKDRLVKGKWPWHAAFCYLIRKFHTRIRKDHIISWFDCICDSIERIINDANMEHAYDGVLWTLRSLQELSALLQFNALRQDCSPDSSFTINEFGHGWDIIWSCLVRCLPTFSNVAYVADAAFTLLGSMIQRGTPIFSSISQDIWDLQLFKCLPTASILWFISCYFSQSFSQGDVRDDLHLRKNLIRSVLALLNVKESFTLNERLVVLLPLALYSLSTGCAPLALYVPEAPDNMFQWAEEHDYRSQHEYFELSVEVLGKIEYKLDHKVLQPDICKGVQLPLKLTNVLLNQMESHTVEALMEGHNRKTCLRDIFYTCALLSNLMYCSSSTSIQLREDCSFLDKLGLYVIKLMDHASLIVEKTRNDVISSSVGPDSIFHSRNSVLSSFKCFVSSPLFCKRRNKADIGLALNTKITQSFERLLKRVAEVFECCSENGSKLQSRADRSDVLDFKAGASSDGSSSHIVDMELDVPSGSEDVEHPLSGIVPAGFAISTVNLKMELLLFLSCFFTVLPAMAWDILFDLAGKESNPSVLKNLLFSLCQHPYWPSERRLLDLITSLNEVVDMQADLKLLSLNGLDAICSLVQSLLQLCRGAKHAWSLNIASFDTELIALGDLVNKVADKEIFDWSSRAKLIDCICNFVLLKPEIGQSMIEKLLLMLHDPDYRVRVTLARQIGVLFKTWEGHAELLQDICVNFGAKIVIFSREKVVSAKEVQAAGPQPRVLLETAIITLMHLAFASEKIEMEAVFIICAVAAMDPSQRELVGAALDNLSKELLYTSRSKYMEELIGQLLFCWIACGVSLVALVENRDLFVPHMEPSNFMQYCCHWLLPALLLNEDTSNLNWACKVACQPSSTLVKSHFIHIFSICMALYCSKNAGWQKGSRVLESSILITAEISQDERDKLIKTNMVSIVNFLFSLAAASDDPTPPLFSTNTIKHALQTVVDGFLEMEDHSRSLGLVDKVNIFRPDRVLMFILEMHYKITAAIHYRHKCNRLACIEVLINVLGDRVRISSTFNYLLNVVGQSIGRNALLGQCCRIISTLILMYRSHPSGDITFVLGEQLQFLVSKLVSCSVSSESDGIVSPATSSEIISLLHHIAMHPDPSLSEYVKELDSFPDSDLFAEIRRVHEELSEGSSPRNQLVNLAKKSFDIPPRILMPRLKALHKKFFGSEGEEIAKSDLADKNWQSDHDAVHAVWNLVTICRLDAIDRVAALVADFVAKIGIGDPHRVVFDLPGQFTYTHRLKVDNANNLTENGFNMDGGMSEQLLCAVLRLLKKYLMEDSVKIIDLSSQALRGVLSTEMGQRALLSLDLCERSLIEVHSKGVNMELVQKLVSNIEQKFCADETHKVGNSALWKTNDKTFEMWICPVVYALIGFCDDVMLRLCQDIVLVKSEVAELLLPKVMVNIARRRNLDVDLCNLISLQVQEHIFTDTNALLKSVKVMLDALNALRLCHVFERAITSSASHKREAVKHAKPSPYGSRSRSLSAKQKGETPSDVSTTLQWQKAYWLPIDYLVAAKAATNCGSYFTALMYVEYWCDEHFKSLTLGSPDFSHVETLPHHIEILISAVTQINEPDSLYGIIQSHKLTSQIVMFEHEGNWTKAFEHYDLLVRSEGMMQKSSHSDNTAPEKFQSQDHESLIVSGSVVNSKKPLKGLIRSLQKLGCTHVLDVYFQGLASQKSQLPHDLEFTELQYEAAWRAGDWDFSLLNAETSSSLLCQDAKACHFNNNLHSCLRALKDGIYNEFDTKLRGAKQELVLCLSNASEESTEYIHSTIVKLQILQHLGMAWNLRWNMSHRRMIASSEIPQFLNDPVTPTMDQLSCLNRDWSRMLDQGQLHMDLLEPVIAFRRVLLQILNCKDSQVQHLLDSASTLRKGRRYSQAAASLHEFKSIWTAREDFDNLYWHGRLEEAKLLRAQGQSEMAINLAKFISHSVKLDSDASDVFHFLGKWLAESRSSSSKTILEKYLKHAVALADNLQADSPHSVAKQCQMHFHLAHYADALFQSYEERLNSNEWQAAMRLRKLKTKELEALIRRLKSSSKGEQTEYTGKILELQKQLKMDKEEAEKLQEDRDSFLVTALEGYKSCLVIGDKYDVTVVFRLVSVWFGLQGKPIVVDGMLSAIQEVQSYKFIPLAYQIASRMGSTKESQGPQNFQYALTSLVKKMAIEHPYHTIFQLLALANGGRIKDKQRSKSSFVVDIDKTVAAENLLKEIYSHHGAVIRQMKQMVEIYIKLAELETKREDTNKKITLPREIRGVRELELVPVVTSNFPVDRSCQYPEGSFPHFKGLTDSVTVMNGINAPKVVECFGSDGKTYRQLAKSGNDDLRQDAVMEQFFGLVNTFLHSHRDTRRRRLRIRTYKVVPFTPSAGVLEWVNDTIPLGEYLIGSMRNGGAHGRYGVGDWTFLKCRQHMTAESDKRKAFQEVLTNFRPVMHNFFLERFSDPADWFEKRLAYTRSVAASSMVDYIVGLGDRHSMNILIDQGTAEVIHIDLGVAFEQGLMLKTPERVPFRLTRDIIDGMGITGVEGVFRRCCEETLSVMRTNKEALLTIVEVFIHDPLYKWALSPLKALQRQKDVDEDLDSNMEDSDEEEYEGNKDAARALMRVKQKLDGYEESELRSVHGQVQQLIQDAIDPDRLCQMFPGWGAWL